MGEYVCNFSPLRWLCFSSHLLMILEMSELADVRLAFSALHKSDSVISGLGWQLAGRLRVIPFPSPVCHLVM